MKKLGLFVVLAMFITLLTSCLDDEGGVQAPVDIATTVKNVEVPFATAKDNKIPFPIEVKLDVDFDKELKDRVHFGLDNVKKAQLTEFTVTLDDSSFVGDLTAIKDMDLYLKAENPSVPEIKVAQVRNNTNKEKINFEVVTEENLVDYMKSDDVYLVLKNVVGGDFSLTTFTVTVKPVWVASFGL